MELANAAIRRTANDRHEFERALIVRSILAEFPAEDFTAWPRTVANAVSRAYADGLTLSEWHHAAVARLQLKA
jgi:hypothetical protein